MSVHNALSILLFKGPGVSASASKGSRHRNMILCQRTLDLVAYLRDLID